MSGRQKRQRGVAVVTALLLTTLAITIVTSLFWQQQVQVRSIENQRLQLQKEWVLRGALDWARFILRQGATTLTDNLDDPWAVPLEETRLDDYVENGRADTEASDATLSGDIIDAQSRYSLNNLCCTKGEVNPREVEVFARLLANLKQNPALAQATADFIKATQKVSVNGVIDTEKPLALGYVDDLLAVPGFSAEIVDKIKDYVVVLPNLQPINVNTASAEVLSARIAALSLTEARTLVANRKKAYFRNLQDFGVRAVPGKALFVDGGVVSVKSRYFIVNGNVRLNRAALRVQSLIERTDRVLQIVWIRES